MTRARARWARVAGVLLVAAGAIVTLRSESRVWYGAVLVGLVLLAFPKSIARRE